MSKKNLDIEILRAFAVLMTMAAHLYALFPWLGGPSEFLGAAGRYVAFWAGVPLFFCISGYVIGKSFIDSMDVARMNGTHWVAAKAFWLRRVYRLLPSAWFWIAFSIGASFLVNQSGAFGDTSIVLRNALLAISDTMNLHTVFGVPEAAGLGVYWSLSLEEQFYLLFPMFLLIVPGVWRWPVMALAILAQFPLPRTGSYIGLRVDPILWGILIFLFSRTLKYKRIEPKWLKNRMASIATTFSIFSFIVVSSAMMSGLPIYMGLLSIVTAIAIFIASFDKGYIFPFKIGRPFLLWIGARSYAIYLVHLPAYLLTNEIWYRLTVRRGLPLPDRSYTLWFIVTAGTLTVAFSEISYRILEVPFRRRGARIASRMTQDRTETVKIGI